MKIVQWTAYGCFGLAALAVVMSASYEAPAFIGAGLVLLAAGVAFLAADHALTLLREIRDALLLRQAASGAMFEGASGGSDPVVPTRSATEIEADIASIRSRV
jgi:hypothetical protein